MCDLRRTPLSPETVNKVLLVWLLTLLSWLGAQPQGDVSRLHHLPYHAHKVVTHGIEVCFPATGERRDRRDVR